MNLAMMQGMRIFNDAITLTRSKKIHVRHEVPEHTEVCETMRIPTDYDYTDWNKDLGAWQCQYCQRVFNTNTYQWDTEEEYEQTQG